MGRLSVSGFFNKERHLKYAERLVLGLELRTTALTVPL